MGYYKLKSVKFNKKENKVTVTAADGRTRPITFYKSEYAKDVDSFEEKVKLFIISCMEGNFHPYNGLKITDILSRCHMLYKLFQNKAGIDPFHLDFDYGSDFNQRIYEFIASEYAVPVIINKENPIEQFTSVIKREDIDKVVAEMQQFKKEKDAEMAKDNILLVSAASYCTMFTGMTLVLLKSGRNNLALIPSDNYTLGKADNSDGKMIFLGEVPDCTWYRLTDSDSHKKSKDYVFISDEEKANFDSVMKKTSGLELTRLPYKEYDWFSNGHKYVPADSLKLGKVSINISGASHYPNKSEGKYYFELMTDCDNSRNTVIYDGVWCNNEGSMEADRDVLEDAISLGLIKSRKEGLYWNELHKIYKEVDG